MASLIDRIRHALGQPATPALAGDDGWAAADAPHPALVPAAVLVPILAAPSPELLLTTRTGTLRRHAGQVAFPGGRIDRQDRGPAAAALREANEEVGLDPQAVEIIGLADSYRTITGFEVRPVVGLLPATVNIRINPAEVADTFRVPLEYVLDPANRTLHETMWQGRRRRYYAIRWRGRNIWGATAGMLVNLAARLA